MAVKKNQKENTVTDTTATEVEQAEDSTIPVNEGGKRQRHIPSVEDALNSLLSDAPDETDAYTVARESLKSSINAQIADLANEVTSVANGTEDKASLAQMLVSLKTVRSRAHKAIDGIPNDQLSVNA